MWAPNGIRSTRHRRPRSVLLSQSGALPTGSEIEHCAARLSARSTSSPVLSFFLRIRACWHSIFGWFGQFSGLSLVSHFSSDGSMPPVARVQADLELEESLSLEPLRLRPHR